MIPDKSRKTGGGSATSAGTEYQAGIMSLLSANIVASTSATPIFGLPADEKVISVRLESQDSIDDLVIETSKARSILIQAKRGIQLGTTATCDLAKTLEQFVGQYIQATEAGTFDAAKDMYVLAAGDTSSQQVHNVAAAALTKLRKGTELTTFNEAEKKAHKVISDHIKRIWKDTKNEEIDDKTLAQILKVTYIQKIDVLDNGSNAQQGKVLLRLILDKPDQDGAAWSVLTSEGLALARQKGKVTASSIDELFRNKAIALKSPAEFDKDILQLQKSTEQTLKSISRSATIKLAGKDIKVNRTVVDELYKQAKAGESFIVVGEPGAGKSGALYEVLEKLKTDGTDIVAIATEKIEATSTGALRNELGLENELSDVLANWKGTTRGVLVIDALDAARDPHAADLFIDIAQSTLEMADGRWSVIISIRKYDLRFNHKIKDVFPQKSISELSDPEFNMAHVNVPLFDDSEIKQLKNQSPVIKELIEKAGSKMEQLLRSPFNLSIAAQILNSGIDTNDLTQIQSQLELLDRYWEVRVTDKDDKKGDARNSLIATALGEMVGQQSLKIGRQELLDKEKGSGEQLDQLLSRNVLVEDKTTGQIGFNHHILYDYGIYKTILRASADSFLRLLKEDRYLALSIRPSIQMYWQYMWQQDGSRAAYWTSVMELEGDAEVTKLVKIFGADFAVGTIKDDADLEPLSEAMLSDDQSTSQKAQAVFRRCSNAMVAAKKRGADDGARHWIKITHQALEKFKDYPMRGRACSTLESAIDSGNLTPEQLAWAAASVRKLLDVEIDNETPDKGIVRTSIRLIAQTYDTDPADSSRVLARMLEVDQVKNFGYIYLYWFAEVPGILADKDPVLVERLYDTAFEHEEKADEVTSMNNSQILGLNSNRKQDYDMVHWQLGQKFGEVIAKDLALGLRILNSVLMHSGRDRLFPLARTPQTEGFDFEGVETKIIEEDTYYWNDDIGINNKAKETVEAFRKFIAELAALPDSTEQLDAAMRLAVATTHAAIFWRIILSVGEQYPDSLGMALSSLLKKRPILTFNDTADKASRFMLAIYPKLSEANRREIEKVVCSLPGGESKPKAKKRLEAMRDSYIQSLPVELIATDPAKTLRKELDKAQPAKAIVPAIDLEGDGLTDEEMDSVYGRKTTPQNTALSALTTKSQTAIGRFRPDTLTKDQADTLLALIKEIEESLEKDIDADTDEGLLGVVRNNLLQACVILIRSMLFNPESPEWQDLRKHVISGSGLAEPVYDKDSDDAFNQDEVIHGPAPRSSAAEGLTVLANREAGLESVKEIHDLIRAASKDEMSAVRANIAGNVHLLWRKDDDVFFKEIVEVFAKNEKSPQVINWLMSSVGRLRSVDTKYVSTTTIKVYGQWKDSNEKNLSKTAVVQLAYLYVYGNDDEAKKELLKLISDPVKYHEGLERMIFNLRESLVHNIDKDDTAEAKQIRSRGTGLLNDLLDSLKTHFADYSKKHDGKKQSELTPEDIEEYKALRGGIENIGMQIYFASGSYKEKKSEPGFENQSKHTFIEEQSPLIANVISTGDVKAAYQFIEMALAYLDTDPVWALKLVESAIRASTPNGASYEQLMASCVVNFVNQFIARHRQHLKDKDNQDLLMNILDEFVDLGWPEAINLTQDLEEIFR